jgi:hypothetical protein
VEMVYYEPSLEKAKANIIYLSYDYYVIGDDSTMAQFDYATQSVVF